MHDEALITLYRRHARFVWQLCRSLGVAEESVDDIVHEVFLVIRRRFADRDRRAPLRAWIARIARHVVMHQQRADRRRRARHEVAAPPTPLRTPEEELGVREAAALMDRFLQGLSEAKRETFVLIEIHGMTAPEVAAIVGANIATIYTRLRAARLALSAFVDALSNGHGRRGEGADDADE